MEIHGKTVGKPWKAPTKTWKSWKNYGTFHGKICEKQIKNNWTEKEIRKSWEIGLKKFKKLRKKYLLYP